MQPVALWLLIALSALLPIPSSAVRVTIPCQSKIEQQDSTTVILSKGETFQANWTGSVITSSNGCFCGGGCRIAFEFDPSRKASGSYMSHMFGMNGELTSGNEIDEDVKDKLTFWDGEKCTCTITYSLPKVGNCGKLADESACKSTTGCKWSHTYCIMSEEPQAEPGCAEQADETACKAKGGCAWNGDSKKCAKAEPGCAEQADETACKAKGGCAWDDDSSKCAKAEPGCAEQADETACKAKGGCAWDDDSKKCAKDSDYCSEAQNQKDCEKLAKCQWVVVGSGYCSKKHDSVPRVDMTDSRQGGMDMSMVLGVFVVVAIVCALCYMNRDHLRGEIAAAMEGGGDDKGFDDVEQQSSSSYPDPGHVHVVQDTPPTTSVAPPMSSNAGSATKPQASRKVEQMPQPSVAQHAVVADEGWDEWEDDDDDTEAFIQPETRRPAPHPLNPPSTQSSAVRKPMQMKKVMKKTD